MSYNNYSLNPVSQSDNPYNQKVYHFYNIQAPSYLTNF